MISNEAREALAELAAANTGEQAREALKFAKSSLGSEAHLYEPLMENICRRVLELEHLRELAGTDELTGIANRRVFHEALRREIARHARGSGQVAIILLDLDGLKDINDTHGHAIGDRALQDVADACVAALRGTDLVARLGGDEFGILLVDENETNARAMAIRVCRKIESCVVKGQPLRVSAGIASTDSAETAGAMFDVADDELYLEKREHHSGVYRTRRVRRRRDLAA